MKPDAVPTTLTATCETDPASNGRAKFVRLSNAVSRFAKATSTIGAVSLLAVGGFALMRLFEGGAEAIAQAQQATNAFDARRNDTADTAGVRVRAVQTQRQEMAKHSVSQPPTTTATASAGKPDVNDAAQAAPQPLAQQPLVQWSQEDIATALAECQRLKASVTVDWQPVAPMRNDACGTPAPVSLRAVGAKTVTLKPHAVTNCRVAAALARWIDDDVQTAAKTHLGSQVVSVSVADAYQCRNRNGATQAPLSEHALANAIDISSFELADGRSVKVASDWGPSARDLAAGQSKVAQTTAAGAAPTQAPASAAAKPNKATADRQGRMTLGVPAPLPSDSAGSSAQTQNRLFLRDIHATACRTFGTVLGPEANEFHRDHFHLDAKVRRGKAFCE